MAAAGIVPGTTGAEGPICEFGIILMGKVSVKFLHNPNNKKLGFENARKIH
jgi:hypothetical protein